MSLDLQIQSSVLKEIVVRNVQDRLRSTCFPTLGTIYLDHADVGAGPVTINSIGPAARFRVPVDIFLVLRENVLAAPNTIPVGATTSAGTLFLELDLATVGPVISLQCVNVDLGAFQLPPGVNAPTMKDSIIKAIGTPVNSDLTPAFQQLGIRLPNSSRVELTGAVVAIRFDPVGAVSPIFPSHQWSLFIDGVTGKLLAQNRVSNIFGPRLTSPSYNTTWLPAGTSSRPNFSASPHVDVAYSGKAQVPDPFAGDVNGAVALDFSLAPTITPQLRTTINWTIHVNLGEWVPRDVEEFVELAIEVSINPAAFGGTPIGRRAFAIDVFLPLLSFGGARLDYAGVFAVDDGMSISGKVRLPADPSRDTFKPSIGKFDLPSLYESCRVLAKSGSGAPTRLFPVSALTTSGSFSLDGAGAYCRIEVVSPGDWILAYAAQPVTGTLDPSSGVAVTFPTLVSLGIAKPVLILVWTARGVRLIDLGAPPQVSVDANGNVQDVRHFYLPDCLDMAVRGPFRQVGINWGRDTEELITPGPRPNWNAFITEEAVLDIQLLTLSGLQPGELLQFRSRDHSIDITANRNGEAIVPTFVPASAEPSLASLRRLNRQSLEGRFSVNTAIFQRSLTFPAAQQHSLQSVEGRTFFQMDSGSERHHYELGVFGAPVLVKKESIQVPDGVAFELSADQTALNPQPLPPKISSVSRREMASLGRTTLPEPALAGLHHETNPLSPSATVPLSSSRSTEALLPQVSAMTLPTLEQPSGRLRPASGPLAQAATLATHDEVALNPQPLPPRQITISPHNPLFGRKIDLPGLKRVFTVPGFANEPILFAEMDDSSTLILDLESDGLVRVAGSFRGPIGPLELSGDWALHTDEHRAIVYHLTRVVPEDKCCPSV
jgi:hypothetical protein